MSKYIFHPGSASGDFRNKLEIQLTARKQLEVADACIIDIPMYLIGQQVFVCQSGNQYRLSKIDIDRINFILRAKSGLKTFTPNSLAMARVKLETLMYKHLTEFGDWKDCVNWACAELDIPMSALEFLYPTTEDYLSITQFKNIRN